MKATINLQTLAAVSLAASTDPSRFYLQGVCLEVTPRAVTYVATNGHILLAAHNELEGEAEPNDLVGAFIIPTEICRGFKWKRITPIATLEAPSATNAQMTINFNGDGRTFKLIDGTFPNWRCVVPQPGPGWQPLSAKTFEKSKPPQFDWANLETMRKFGDKLEIGMPHAHYSDESAPVPITFNVESAFGIVMPYRNDADPWQAPAWLNKSATTEAKATGEP